MPVALILHQPGISANVPRASAVPIDTVPADPMNRVSPPLLLDNSPPEKPLCCQDLGLLAPASVRGNHYRFPELRTPAIRTSENGQPSVHSKRDDLLDTSNVWFPSSPTHPAPSKLKSTSKASTQSHASPLIHAFMAKQTRVASIASQVPDVASPNPLDPVEPPSSVLPEIAQRSPEASDPELGVIRLRDSRQDPELGIIRLRNSLQDSELGVLRLRPLPPAPPPQPYLFLSTYVSISSSSNIFLLEDPVIGRVSDNFIRPGLSLIAFPSIGPRTNLLASVETNFLRYQDSGDANFDELRFRAGVRHSLSNRTYGQLSWSGQLLFDQGFDDQFFTNHSIELLLGRRDPLLPNLTLDSFYQGQVSFSNPDEFSSFVQSLGASLGYRLNAQWEARIGYQITLSDFIEIRRQEAFQRVTAQLRYSISPSVRVSLFGGIGYGESSQEDVSFDSSFIGISLDATLKLF